MSYIRLEPITLGDLYPFYYWRFWEVYEDANGDVREKASDLSADYGDCKICIRRSDNRDDPNDHTLDSVYENMTKDIANLAHYEWKPTNTDEVGTYVIRFELTRTGGKIYHPPVTYEFDIINKMPSKLRSIS